VRDALDRVFDCGTDFRVVESACEAAGEQEKSSEKGSTLVLLGVHGKCFSIVSLASARKRLSDFLPDMPGAYSRIVFLSAPIRHQNHPPPWTVYDPSALTVTVSFRMGTLNFILPILSVDARPRAVAIERAAVTIAGIFFHFLPASFALDRKRYVYDRDTAPVDNPVEFVRFHRCSLLETPKDTRSAGKSKV